MNKGNLLIVDDEPVLLRRLKVNLEDYADDIFTASDGLEALKILAEKEVHCVICDVNMPRMNGIEVIKKLRSDDNHVPFIFYTAHGNHEMMLEVAKYGAFDFFKKPNFEGLEKVISRGLQEGFKRPTNLAMEEEFLSDYQKLLNDLDKQ